MFKKFLRDMGSEILNVGTEIRRTAGIGVGSIEMSLEKNDYAPGETIVGNLRLDLEEDTEAKRLVVRLVGVQDKVNFVRDVSGRKTRSITRETIYKFDNEIGGKKLYTAGHHEYDFTIVTPYYSGGTFKIPGEGKLRDVAQMALEVALLSSHPVQWKVVGFLDTPWKRKIKKKVDIILTHV